MLQELKMRSRTYLPLGMSKRGLSVAILGVLIVLAMTAPVFAQAPPLELSRTTWGPTGSGSATSISVISDTAWAASSNATSWLTVSPASGNGDGELILNAAPNTSGTQRTGKVTVTAGPLTATINVTQASAIVQTAITVNTTTWDAFEEEESIPVTVTTMFPSLKVVSSDPSWLTVSSANGNLNKQTDIFSISGGNGTLILHAAENPALTRTATVTIFLDSPIFTGDARISQMIYVTQAGALELEDAVLEVSRATWDPTGSGSATNISVSSNLAWKASSNATSWLTVSPAGGTGDGTLILNAAGNISGSQRTGKITLKSGPLTVTINVTQAKLEGSQPALRLNTTVWDAAAETGSISVAVTTTLQNWKVSSSDLSWLDVLPGNGNFYTQSDILRGSGNATLIIHAAPNATTPRTGTITISWDSPLLTGDNRIAQTIFVSQDYNDTIIIINEPDKNSSHVTQLAVTTNTQYYLLCTGKNISTLSDKVFSVTYDPNELELADAAVQARARAIAPGQVPNTNIRILSAEDGLITFKVERDTAPGTKWSGVLTIMEFKSKINGTAAIALESGMAPLG